MRWFVVLALVVAAPAAALTATPTPTRTPTPAPGCCALLNCLNESCGYGTYFCTDNSGLGTSYNACTNDAFNCSCGSVRFIPGQTCDTGCAFATPPAAAPLRMGDTPVPTGTFQPTPTTTPYTPVCTCQGDANKDGVVNQADFASVQQNFGQPANPLTGAGDSNCDGFVNNADFVSTQAHLGESCGTATPTGTPTATPTVIPTCGPALLVGQVFDVYAVPAANRRFTIQVVREQIIHGCLVHISLKTVRTDDRGFLQADATTEAGAVIRVTLEDDVPLEITVPDQPIVELAPLIAGATSRPPGDTITDIQVASGGDYSIAAVHTGLSETLTTGTVHHFTLTSNADANGWAIASVGTGITAGDLLPAGQPAEGDLEGDFPSPTLATTRRSLPSMAIGGANMPPGDCLVTDTYTAGAEEGDAVAVSPVTPSPHLIWTGFVPMHDIVRISVCALGDTTPVLSRYNARVFR